MSNIVLVIGPSGVGKSTAINFCQNNSLLPSIEIKDLDHLVSVAKGLGASQVLSKRGPEGFFDCCMEAISDLKSNANQLYLIAVGAGTLESEKALNFIRTHKSILITASENECYSRIKSSRIELRTEEEYISIEFSDERNKIYKAATASINTTEISEECTARLLACMCEQLLKQ